MANKSLYLATTMLAAFPFSANAQTYNAGLSSAWFSQIGLTSAVETSAAGGSGMLIALVDTGVNPSATTLKGGISALSSCVMTLYACKNSYVDDNGHGTAVASIMAGSTTSGGMMSGVAPSASILAVKALNSVGNGSFTDVNTGIRAAANAGAKVINLSLTFSPDANTIAAINYAASKGAYIVYAGGNSGTSMFGSPSTALTTAAKNQLVFAGSVGANNVKNSWSNSPGTGYQSMWLMAPGESIVAPGINNTNSAWSGTSMAAPIVSGSIALLTNTWPILGTNGTAIKLLATTATDLGAKGVDATYGNGLINLSAAFQPVGGLTVNTGGKTYSVVSLTPSILSGGALGSLPAISAQLANYPAFDGFARNFSVNLSGLLATKSSTTGAQVLASARTPTVKATTSRFADGSSLTFATEDAPRLLGGAAIQSGLGNDSNDKAISPWMATFVQADGTIYSAGYGFSPEIGFASALWGGDTRISQQAANMDVSNALLGLAQGGMYGAYGISLGPDSRFAVSFSSTSVMQKSEFVSNDWTSSKAMAIGAGYTTKLSQFWLAGFTVGMLNENDGLLGSTYDSSSLISLGDHHQSMSIGTSHAFNLSAQTSLLLDGALVKVSGATAGGLITDVSTLYARSYGVSLMSHGVFDNDDTLTASIKKPLRIVSGTANVATMTVDSAGLPVNGNAKVSMVPSGSQTDISIAYSTMITEGIKAGAAVTYSRDAQNIVGQNDVGGMVNIGLKF